jgi:hypothetical protein
MLEPRSDPAPFRWRRTAFARIDGAVDIAEDDWSLMIDRLPAARIYRVNGGPNDGRWFWAVQIGPGRVPFNGGTGHAGGGREAREACEAILRAMGDA